MRRLLPRASCALVGALAYIPLHTQMPTADLDASWGAVLQEASRHGWQFGPDLTFTYGPLGYLAVPFFAPDFFWWVVAARLVMGAVCGWAFHEIAARAGWPRWVPLAVWLALLPPSMASFDVPWILPVVLWPFVALRTPLTAGLGQPALPARSGDAVHQPALPAGSRAAVGQPAMHFETTASSRVSLVLICLTAIVGLTALVKFTIAMLATLLAVLLTIDDVGRRRRPPWTALVLVATVLLLWLLTGQALRHLPIWLHTSWAMSSAYSETMSTTIGTYQIREMVVFALNGLALLVASAWSTSDGRTRAWRLVPLGAVALLLFVQFKLGFVRHDAHATAAMFAMPMIGVLVSADGLASGARRSARVLLVVALVLGFGSYAYGLRRYFDRLAMPEHYRAYFTFQARAIGDVLQPRTTHARLSTQRDAALQRLRSSVPLPHVDGTVDVYGHHQAYALAQGLPYRPRPVFQSYGAYTSALADLNRRTLESAQGVRHVLFDVETPDFRYPLLDDGASVPVLLARYDVRGKKGPFIHLERRPEPRRVQVVPLRVLEGRVGETITLGDTPDTLWGTIAIGRTLWGRLLTTAYKLPPINVFVTTADGTQHQHRLLRDVAGSGMLISPLVPTHDDFVRLHAQEAAPASRRVVQLRVDVDWESAYDSRVRVSLGRLEVR
ncbi:MAG TPA: hypothetical protein VMF13_05405 [Luteitalea sp.]|nr:hypothetical protein [Luteitalea sp.]